MKIETPNTPHTKVAATAESRRLEDAEKSGWRRWGPYLSARQWGTVREDYSADGDAWGYFPHDHARSRCYRWGEDGIGGFADDQLNICMAPAFWNGRDAILKERLFGLTNAEGNHGEDVKELYYFLDATPTHSYMRMLYKYPQAPFPYSELVEVNHKRGLHEPEYEIEDTGVFDESAYFDITIEYAKADTDDIAMRISARNRGGKAARLWILPHIWARNTWSWGDVVERPRLRAVDKSCVSIFHPKLPRMLATFDTPDDLIFCDNETNTARLYGRPGHGFCKDGINDFVVGGDLSAVNSERFGTKCAALYARDVPPGGEMVVRVRCHNSAAAHDTAVAASSLDATAFDALVALRRREADEFYSALQCDVSSNDGKLVQRQAFGGLLWSKQFYGYDVRRWLAGDPGQPPPPSIRRQNRNSEWGHLALNDVLSMPDTWEFPWFAAWDLAFNSVALALVDPGFAKSQLVLLTQARCLHPRGQLPAYEWNFNDVNPPVHAWAALKIYQHDRESTGVADTAFLKRVLHELLLNFTWWVNREDPSGRNLFHGGFLGLDNVGVLDRSKLQANGDKVDQSDGTAWMAMYALNLMRIALELATEDHVYEDLAIKFFEHFLYIAGAIHGSGDGRDAGLWDDDDGFYYDSIESNQRGPRPLRVRSVVGLIPLLAVEVLSSQFIRKLPDFHQRMDWFMKYRSDLAGLVSHFMAGNENELHLLSLMRRDRMNRVLARLLDENEFLSDFGIRSLSKVYEKTPYEFEIDGEVSTISYEPGEGTSRIYGGNSNWRGPIWMPINFLIIDALRQFHTFYGDAHRVEFPTGSGQMSTLAEVADGLTVRLTRLFLKNKDGTRASMRPSPGQAGAKPGDDLVLFHEYFHGETGRGLGASHQTGWTALVAWLLRDMKTESPTVAPSPNEQRRDTGTEHERALAAP